MPSLPVPGYRPDRPDFDRLRLRDAAQPVSGAVTSANPAPAHPVSAKPEGLPQAADAEALSAQPLQEPDAALRFLQRWQSLASQPAETPALLHTTEQAQAHVERLQWQLTTSPAQALQAQGNLDPARVAQWLQY